MSEHFNGTKRANWVAIAALIVSLGSTGVALTSRWTSQSAVVDFHERRLTGLESWQGETRATLHEMDKKLDRLLATQHLKDR